MARETTIVNDPGAWPIALLTDFGYRDAYAGVMKGVLLDRCPGAVLFDLTHGVAAQDIRGGALQLLSAAPYCPAETVFLAVVDPGVGSERAPICIRSGRRLFVGPDNGLLWPAAAACGEPEAFRLENPEYRLPSVGATFHGRDLFAPAAAALARGVPPEELGPRHPEPVRWEIPIPAAGPEGVTGEVIYVDGFGNAVTNLRPADLGEPAPGSITFEIGGRRLEGPAPHYACVPPGEPVVVLGSLGFYEAAVNQGSAAAALGIGTGDRIAARVKERRAAAVPAPDDRTGGRPPRRHTFSGREAGK